MATPQVKGRAGKLDIVIEQGATFYLDLTWKDRDGVPLDLTGYSARMKIKTAIGGTEIDSLVSPADITLGGALGTIAIVVSATDTAAYSAADFTEAVYDLELVNGSDVRRLIQGKVSLSEEVTT